MSDMSLLASSQSSQRFETTHRKGTLTTTVVVRQLTGSRCCTRVDGTFSIQIDSSDDTVNAIVEIGALESYLVSRTALAADGSAPAWLQEVLHTGYTHAVGQFTAADLFTKTGDCALTFKELYDDPGNPQPKFAAFAEELSADKVLYIQEIELDEDYRGEHLGQFALQCFHQAIVILPNGYAFSGTIVLCPCPTDPHSHESVDVYDQEVDLIGFYERLGYRLWKHEVGVCASPIMGRRLP